ncbi:MAG: SirB2 family protein [Betaproteobacteria bacterium]|nr:SirB2 family protein [Betaproteobacteria bacterium]MCL2887063.1 SirB2 family protein [Betaproteobacteria bacterium]
MSYLAVKHLHVTCVVLSGLGFCLRGWWMASGSPRLRARLTRVLPHGVDTVLLGSALMLAWTSSQYPFVENWLTAKLFGLLAYIGCGAMALKRAAHRAARLRYLFMALCAYAYIVGVALSRSPFLL